MLEPIPLVTLLLQTEECLKQSLLWDDRSPSEHDLASQQPFALDTLAPEQWLQWVFIPKMRLMVEEQKVAKGFSISPYFEEVWKQDDSKSELISLLHLIDKACQ